MQALPMQKQTSSDWRVHEIMGRKVRVYDSFSVAMRLHAMLSDPELQELCTPAELAEAAMFIVLPDPARFAEAFGHDAWRAFQQLLWDCFGMDTDGSHPHEKPVMDWEEDEARIKATALMAYGLTWDRFGELPYMDACSLIGLAPYETPMGQALHYRTAKRPKRTKYNREEVEAFDKAREHYRLRGRGKAASEGSMKAANAAASSAFDRMAEKVRNHG